MAETVAETDRPAAARDALWERWDALREAVASYGCFYERAAEVRATMGNQPVNSLRHVDLRRAADRAEKYSQRARQKVAEAQDAWVSAYRSAFPTESVGTVRKKVEHLTRLLHRRF